MTGGDIPKVAAATWMSRAHARLLQVGIWIVDEEGTPMDVNSVKSMRTDLDRLAGDRFAARKDQRDAKATAIEENGILAAAGLASAVQRAMQLTVAEGRTAIRPMAVSATAFRSAPVETPETPVDTDRRLESIVGFNDTDPINFLEHGIRAGQSVCRLLYGQQPIGTGFLVAPNVLLTNHHVIPDTDAAADFIAQFDYELDANENPLVPKRFRLDPSQLFVTSQVDAFDFTFVAVQPQGLTGEPLSSFGWLPLNPSAEKIL